MKPLYQSYYCYVNEGTPVILENKPENFEELPCRYIARCPSFDIAERTFKCNLRIAGWRFWQSH